jgi:hypothetical protein
MAFVYPFNEALNNAILAFSDHGTRKTRVSGSFQINGSSPLIWRHFLVSQGTFD